MSGRRVVVTGLGSINPCGLTAPSSWQSILSSKSGVSTVQAVDLSDLDVRIAGEIKTVDVGGSFNPTDHVNPRELRRMGKYALYALVASEEAVKDSGISKDILDPSRIGVIIGSGIGGIEGMEKAAQQLLTDYRKISPFFLPSMLSNMAAGMVSIKYGFTGVNHTATTACSTGNYAIGDAYMMIKNDMADVVLSGGCEASICRIGITGFSAMKALSTAFNDTPEKASRPWDKDRDGFVMGEGAGILVLEEYEMAKKRGAKIYAEVVGYGIAGDAYHMTAPHPEGNGAFGAMNNALRMAKISANEIDYVNAHGTSTPIGDVIEIKAMRRLFGDDISNVAISSTKSLTGHLLGAAGAVEAVFSVMSLVDQKVPPTLNLDNPEEICEGINLVPHVYQDRKMNYAMSNAFGFGGCNASLVFKKAE